MQLRSILSSTAAKRFWHGVKKRHGKLSYLSASWRAILFWPAVILVLVVTGWLALLSKLDADRNGVEKFALKESATLSQAYADHLARNFESFDQIALHVKYQWELSYGRVRLEDARMRGLYPSPELVLVTIVDKEGTPVTSTFPLKKQVNLSDTEYFTIHKDFSTNFLYISELVTGRISGKPVIQFTRRLFNEDGSFAGVVVVSVDPAFLVSSFDFNSLGRNGLLAAIGEDRAVRISRIGKTVAMPDQPAFRKLPDMSSPSGQTLLDGAAWFTDGRNRFVAWQELKNYPFIALAGLDEEEVMGSYQASREGYIQLALLATLAALAVAIFAMNAAARLAAARRQAQVVRDAYRMATEVGNDGFFICRAVYGDSEDETKITDFILDDCNSRGAQMLGRSRKDLIGFKLSEVYPKAEFEKARALGRKVMELGTYADEYQVPEGSLIKAKWVDRKLIRSGDSIAITMRDITESKEHIQELERRGNEDALTSLHNRHWLHSFLPAALKRAARDSKMLALLFIDIDGFKNVNDSMGHAAGDELLRIAAARLHSVIRPQDQVVRLGGDEFLIVLENVEQQETASHIAKRVLDVFGEKFKLRQGTQTLGVSVGISMFPTDGTDAKTLLQNADIAMYSAKQSGKGQSHFYDPVFYDNLKARLDIERRLREAIDYDQFEMFYQPRVDMQTGRVCGMEALIRWNHPRDGLIEPLRFITVAEETGLILNLGAKAMEKVCAQLAQWTQANQKCVPVSINVSPRQFHEGNVKSVLAKYLTRYEVAPDLVEIEVTESSMMGETEEISMEMEALQNLGIKLLVDDFGTGYSSLSQLQRLDMDGLKIDRAFTNELGRSEEGEVFFSAIVTMAHALGMRVVAEGVETKRQVEILKRLSCDEIQGYYVSRPVPAREIPALINSKVPIAA